MSNEKKPDFLTVGTSACAIFGALLGALIAALLLWIGFWKTLFIALLTCVGLFIGGVADKKGCISGVADKLFPQKELHPYKAKDVKITAKAGEEEARKADAEEAAEEPAPEDAVEAAEEIAQENEAAGEIADEETENKDETL